MVKERLFYDVLQIKHVASTVDLTKCPRCKGPADNGNDRCVPPSPYLCTRCTERSDNLNFDNYTDEGI